jgi:hypothetical protein
MYIPACPLTEANAEYLKRQRETFVNGTSFRMAREPPNTCANVLLQEHHLPTSLQGLAKASIWAALALTS